MLSGHRGLPSAKLFTNLDQIVEGDTFVIRVLDEVLTYEVDRILIVEPEDVVALPMLLALLLVLLLSGGRRSRRDDGDDTDPDA